MIIGPPWWGFGCPDPQRPARGPVRVLLARGVRLKRRWQRTRGRRRSPQVRRQGLGRSPRRGGGAPRQTPGRSPVGQGPNSRRPPGATTGPRGSGPVGPCFLPRLGTCPPPIPGGRRVLVTDPGTQGQGWPQARAEPRAAPLMLGRRVGAVGESYPDHARHLGGPRTEGRRRSEGSPWEPRKQFVTVPITAGQRGCREWGRKACSDRIVRVDLTA